MSEERFESEYTQYFDSIAKECDINNLSEHALGALFWDKQQEKLDQKDKRIKELEKLFSDYYPLNDFIQSRANLPIESLGMNYGDIAVDVITRLEKQNKEMLEAIKASCEFDESWIGKEKYEANYYEGEPEIERYKIFKKIIEEQGE